MARLLLLLVAGMIFTAHASLIAESSLPETELMDVEEKDDLEEIPAEDKEPLINSEDLDVDSKEITDGEANEDELDEPAVAPAPDDEKFSVNGEELREEDFDEDPTEVIDGEPQPDEMESPAKVHLGYGRWKKIPYHWCTIQGRKFLSGKKGVKQYFWQCARQCNKIRGCNAVEMWFAYNWNCYWCTRPDLIRPYTNKHDLAYPAHVWVRQTLPEKNPCDWPVGVCTYHKDPCPPDIPYRCSRLDYGCKVPTNHCCCRKPWNGR